MENYQTEEEQVEALKRWWRENGRSTLVAVGLALALGFGWQGWQRSREQAAQNASLRFQSFIEALDAEARAEAPALDDPRELGRELVDDLGSGSIYGQLAALHLARLSVLDGDLEQAETRLRWVLDGGARDAVADVTRLRLARVVSARGDTDAALALLADAGDNGFSAAYAIARGDTLLDAGREAEALESYRQAEASLAAQATLPRGLREKLDYLSSRAVTDAAIDTGPEGAVDPQGEKG